MTETVNKKWSDEVVSKLMSLVGSETPVQPATVEAAAEALGVSVRSVASKLRQLDVEVASLAKVKEATFTPEQGVTLAEFVNANVGKYTYKEIAEQFPGNFTPKQVQGKLLALELTASVKPAEKVEVARMYSPEEEVKFIEMANAGAFIEDIASALGREIPSVRGKALSLSRSGEISGIPTQRASHAKNVSDAVADLGDAIVTMTVAAIAAAVDKTERGVRTLLTRRGLKVVDYDGAVKRAKAEAKAEAKAAAA
jgi:hypothetical protein